MFEKAVLLLGLVLAIGIVGAAVAGPVKPPSAFDVERLGNFSCKGQSNCKTLSVMDNSVEVFSVTPEGNVTVTGDLTVKGHINGAAPACPVCVTPPPAPQPWWLAVLASVWLGAGCLGAILAGVELYRRLN